MTGKEEMVREVGQCKGRQDTFNKKAEVQPYWRKGMNQTKEEGREGVGLWERELMTTYKDVWRY